MEPMIVISIIGGAIVLLLLIGAKVKPVNWIGKLLVKVVIGAFCLFLLNAAGASLGVHIPINLTTSAISGILGIPGIAALLVIKNVILA
ncbi:pro-sigmaK processing inhibitor BofA family protein [Metabacillus sp. RGM 3146]|uniref:pro-sigmaK processing inhibitor BofA family protein n=1 Tax=Metabacillus sp. RGM 3146 TaxID=3401092 RepID=UPI003B9D1C1B